MHEALPAAQRNPRDVLTLFLTLTSTLALAACDGYPTEDAPAIDPFALTNEQRLNVLNEIGETLEPRRRFKDTGDCSLAVEGRSGLVSRSTTKHHLLDLSVDVRRAPPEVEVRYYLELRSQKSGQTQALLGGRDLLDLERAEQLLTLMARDCRSRSRKPFPERPHG